MSKTTALKHVKMAIIGGGAGGVTVASQLLGSKLFNGSDITVFDPKSEHHYQPGYTMLSGGLLGNNDIDVEKSINKILVQPMNSVFNSNINLVSEYITEFDPDNNKIYNSYGDCYLYDYLIINTGIQLRYDLIEGAYDALNDDTNKVGSMYQLEYAKKLNQITNSFYEGKLISTQPRMPIKCAGAPQKYIYLADALFRDNKCRNNIDFNFYTALPVMFGVPRYNEKLIDIVADKGIKVHYNKDICKVDDNIKKVYFKDTTTGDIIEDSYDMLNIVPPQSPTEIMRNAPKGLVDNVGFVDVNQSTLQCNNYENIFALGDCANTPTAKTAAAIYAQTPILVNNLTKYIEGKRLNANYNGYTSCPILVGNNKVLLAEFMYGGIPKETFNNYMDQSKPQSFFYFLKRYAFPFAYWNLQPKALWYGTNGPFKPTYA